MQAEPKHTPRAVDSRTLKIAVIAACLIAAAAPSLVAQVDERVDKGQKAALILKRHGFEPRAVTFKAGKVAIYVYNRVGLDELALKLERENSPTDRTLLKQERVERGRLKWRNFMTLEAGTYILSEETRPDVWKAVITVTR